MSGPVNPPLEVDLSDGSSEVRPCNHIAFDVADFVINVSDQTATVRSVGSGSATIGGSITSGQVAYGAATADTIEGSAKLTWVDTAGSESLTITGSSTGTLLKITSTADTSNESPDITLFKNTPDPQDGDELAAFIWRANSTDGASLTETTYVELMGTTEDVTTGSENAGIRLRARYDGDLVDMMTVESHGSGSDITFNEEAKDIDFRIESVNEANILRVNAGQDNIGIGSNPDSAVERLHVLGTGDYDTLVRFESTDTDANAGPNLQLYRNPGEAGVTNDDLGKLEWWGPDDSVSGTPQLYSEIQVEAQGVGAGTQSSRMMFRTMIGGVLKEWMRASSNTVEINAFSDDINFKIEGDDAAHINFFSDAGNNNVGLGGAPNANVEALHVLGTGASSTTLARFETEEDGAGSAPHIELYRNSATPANGDDMGEIFFSGNLAATSGGASAGTEVYGRIRQDCVNVVSGSEDGILMFDVVTGGSLAEYMRFNASSGKGYIVFNELGASGNDIDFRIEGTGNDSLFRTDAANDLIGIGGVPSTGLADVDPILQVAATKGSILSDFPYIIKDTAGTLILVADNCRGQRFVYTATSGGDLVLQLPVGVAGMQFSFVAVSENVNVDPDNAGTGNTINGVTTVVPRDTAFEIYDVFCYAAGKWMCSNPN